MHKSRNDILVSCFGYIWSYMVVIGVDGGNKGSSYCLAVAPVHFPVTLSLWGATIHDDTTSSA